jgi:hypothetical protein
MRLMGLIRLLFLLYLPATEVVLLLKLGVTERSELTNTKNKHE